MEGFLSFLFFAAAAAVSPLEIRGLQRVAKNKISLSDLDRSL